MIEPLAQLTPGRYLSTPSLWLGLLLAAAFIVAAFACGVIADLFDSMKPRQGPNE